MFWKIASSDKNILKAGSCVDAKFYYEMLSSKNFLATHVLLNNKFVLKLYGFFFFTFGYVKIIFHKPECVWKIIRFKSKLKAFQIKLYFYNNSRKYIS